MRDEHADACGCRACVPTRLVVVQAGDSRQPLAAAIAARMPAVLARDLRAVFAPVTTDLPAAMQDALDNLKTVSV